MNASPTQSDVSIRFAVLRELYANTQLRESELMRLCTLDQLSVRDGVLAFMRDQQDCLYLGILLTSLDEDPAIFADTRGAWTDDGCTLSELLELFSLTNRPYVSRCRELDTDIHTPPAGWRTHAINWCSIQHELWSRDDAVYELVTNRLGAKDRAALDRARAALR